MSGVTGSVIGMYSMLSVNSLVVSVLVNVSACVFKVMDEISSGERMEITGPMGVSSIVVMSWVSAGLSKLFSTMIGIGGVGVVGCVMVHVGVVCAGLFSAV